jgi:serine/threonine protein kinase
VRVQYFCVVIVSIFIFIFICIFFVFQRSLSKDFDRKMCAWPDELFDLLGQLLELNPAHRISAADAMRHPFFRLEPVSDKRYRADDGIQSRHRIRYSLGKEPCAAIWNLMQRTICAPTDADWVAFRKALKSASRLKQQFYSDNVEPGPDETSMRDAILPFLSFFLLKHRSECPDSLPADHIFPDLISDSSSPRTRRLNQSSSRVRVLEDLEDMAIMTFSLQERQYFQTWRLSEELIGYPLADVKPLTRTERHQKRARDAAFRFKQERGSEN